jgi:putative heme-binding domain-containing protein
VKIANPIELALGPDGLIYASNQTGEVYSLRDTDEDGLEDMALLFCNVKDLSLRSPSAFTHRGDTIFIGTAQQVRAFLDEDKDGKADTSWVFFDDIPTSEHPYEWTCGLTFGADNCLYLALSTDSWNAGPSPDPNGYRGSILKISPNGKTAQRIATGIRSVYGLSFNQENDLFFTDNEGGGNTNEELNLLVKNGFYGHNPKKYTFDSIVAPVHALNTEMAPSGIEFNSPDNDFGGTGGNLFIAFYGPGERWSRGGVGRVSIQRHMNGNYSFKEFPVADIPKLSNLAFGKDGSLYLAQHGKTDYWYNAIHENEGTFYKLIYDPTLPSSPEKKREVFTMSLSENSVEAGKQLFAERACLGCHSVDDQTELLGPNLKDVGKRLSRQEILEEILKPSERIKPSEMAVKILKKDGQVLIGRVVNANEKQISLMLVGNSVVDIQRSEIEKTEDEEKSLMYEGLLGGTTDSEKESLLDYIVSLSQ